MSRRRVFGSIRKLPGGTYQARYNGPDHVRYTRGETFNSEKDAGKWLDQVKATISLDTWKPPTHRADLDTFGPYAANWLAQRSLAPRSRVLYEQLLRDHILPRFERVRLVDIEPDTVRDWYAKHKAAPAARAHSYGLLKAILQTAAGDRLIVSNPCVIRGAASTKRATVTKPATLAELEAIASAMPERYRAMVLIAAWCGLRFGELAELRRKDIDVTNGVVKVRRAMVLVHGRVVIGKPKTDAGIRDVAVPPHVMPALARHLDEHAAPGRDGLLFPARHGGHLAAGSLSKVYYPARANAGRPDLRWHDLRHTASTLAASTGATQAELMARLGHVTARAAMTYQHAAQNRDKVIALALSALVAPSSDAQSKSMPLSHHGLNGSGHSFR